MNKKLLITGANGLLGSNLVYHAADRYEVTACSLTSVGSSKPVRCIQMDVTQEARVREVVTKVGPDVIIHCAAETRVDFCEDNRDHAAQVNTVGTAHIGQAAEDVGALVVYVSSDSVFDGARGNYTESDLPNPLNVYSKTKAAGERALVDCCSRHLIARTNMFGWNMKPKQSLSEWVLSRLRAGETISGFQDVVFAPLIVNDIATLLLDMVEGGLSGLYHVCARDHLSKYEFARRIAEQYGLDTALVKPSSLDQASLMAPRPKLTFLDVTRVEADLGRNLPTVDDGLRRFRELGQSGFAADLKSGLDGD